MASSLLIGVNLSGAEFGDALPGTYGVDYTYPTHAEVDYYASKGLEVIRLPFMWERLQHTEFGALDATELARLDDFVNYATSKGLTVDLNPQDFGYGFGHLIGSAQTPNSAFADFWGKVAAHFESNPNVIFGLMNEPHDQSATAWLESVNAAITAIRNTGATQEILVPGSYWDGAWTWTTSDNAAVIGTGVQDPLHNYAFEVHQYLDPDGSGTQPGTSSTTIGVERVTAITQWAESTGSRLFLGEVGVSTDQTSLTALDLMLDYIAQHTDVWQAANYWAGGPWWPPDYMFSIEPAGGVDKPQMAILVDHLSSVGGSISAAQIQADYLAITRTTLSIATATTVSIQINAGTQTETNYIDSLLTQVATTTIPAVAVEATMYNATGTSATITSLTTTFLPPQLANAIHYGLNAQVYACEALGLTFAFGNESGGTAFANNFGPSNSAMPNTTAGDLAFAQAASSAIFGSAATADTPGAIDTFVVNWKTFFTSNGIPGISHPTATQVDIAARGAAWGDAVGITLDNGLGLLLGQVTNFLDDAAQGTAIYGAPLLGQPIHPPFV